MKRVCSLCCLALIAVVPAFGSSAEVTVTPFQKPGTLLAEANFRFLEVETLKPASQNVATHVLLEGLFPVDQDQPLVVSSTYVAVNSASGEEQDRGVELLDLPSSAVDPEVVTSPIVGVVRREGPWSALSPVPVAGTTIGGASGDAGYDRAAGTLSLTLSRLVGATPQSLTGTATYNAVDVDTLYINPFTVSVGGDSFSFAGTTLTRNGFTFTGLLESTGLTGAQYSADSLMYRLTLVDLTDADGDGIPDITDPSVVVGPDPSWTDPAEQVGGDHFRLPWLGDFHRLGPDLDQAWIYSWEHGLLYAHGATPTSLFLYDFNLGWVWTGQNIYPYLYKFTPGGWILYFEGSAYSGNGRLIFDYTEGVEDYVMVPPSGSSN